MSALDWKDARYPMYRKLGGTQDRSGDLRKISHLQELDPQTVQSVAISYSSYVVRAHTQQLMQMKYRFEILVNVCMIISDDMRSKRVIVAFFMYAWRFGSLFEQLSIPSRVPKGGGFGGLTPD
jgi:hypothetical protein